MQTRKIFVRTLGVVALATASLGAHAVVVLANNAAPGDAFTNAAVANQGQAVGATGWYYNNVRNSGTAGIRNTYAQSRKRLGAFAGHGGSRRGLVEGRHRVPERRR